MTSTVTQSALDANLAALGEGNADLARHLRDTPSATDLEFTESRTGPLAATRGGRQLCSLHDPLREAERLAQTVDVLENATVVILGFGMGYHVKALAERIGKTGIIIVFEPDLALLRAVLEQVDHAAWMHNALLIFITDPHDHSGLAGKLAGAEAIVTQGIALLEHPASRARLGTAAAQFSATMTEHVTGAKTTLMTTLVRSVDTVRNLLHNVDHYVAGSGIAELDNIAAGRLAVLVAAGPSLHRNLHLLTRPEVRDRCVIIAAQTVLKPMLAAGVRPHFVTALDYHEISRRFYEGLTAEDIEDVTLIADPKAHPFILDAFPGRIRCCGESFIDTVLGDLRRDMGTLPPGATVAHLSMYLARFMGCNPIAFIGQDLGFTDGLYYAPGTAIDEIWAPELNAFNTVEMMQWQRIVRHRVHLSKTVDVHGRSIYTDAQMQTYRQQFEREFSEYVAQGVRVIDATEGGAAKQHTEVMPLADVLDAYATVALPPLPRAALKLDQHRLDAAHTRLEEVKHDIADLREISRKTTVVIRKMLDDQGNAAKMNRHFQKIEHHRTQVEERFKTFEMLNHLNQLGVFKRMKADRRIHLLDDQDPMERQRAQLDRDLVNVTWLIDAADEFLAQLNDAQCVLQGTPVSPRPRPLAAPPTAPPTAPARVAALVPVDPHHNGLGQPRDLHQPFGDTNVLQATLRRLGRVEDLHTIVLLVPSDFNVEPLIDQQEIGRPIIIERCDGSPFGPEQRAIAVARRWAMSSWRGGIAGMSAYDELLSPLLMASLLEQYNLTAALLVGPDWPLVDVTTTTGCGAVVRRYLEHPEKLNLVVTQAPPGRCGCLITASLLRELSTRTRLSTIGALLTYQPHAPQADPVAADMNVQIPLELRRPRVRFTADSPATFACLKPDDPDATRAALEQDSCRLAHVILELTSERTSTGRLAAQMRPAAERPRMDVACARRVIDSLTDPRAVTLTFAGAGDPLLHEALPELIGHARDAGVAAVHVRTELRADPETVRRMVQAPVDVISIDLHADRARTYEFMLGDDRFADVLSNMQLLLDHRRHLAGPEGPASISLPWIVPRLQRRAETIDDIDSFFDRWTHTVGTAVIEPIIAPEVMDADPLLPVETPLQVLRDLLLQRMVICSDGSVPVNEKPGDPGEILGNARADALPALWMKLSQRRRALLDGASALEAAQRMYLP